MKILLILLLFLSFNAFSFEASDEIYEIEKIVLEEEVIKIEKNKKIQQEKRVQACIQSYISKKYKRNPNRVQLDLHNFINNFEYIMKNKKYIRKNNNFLIENLAKAQCELFDNMGIINKF